MVSKRINKTTPNPSLQLTLLAPPKRGSSKVNMRSPVGVTTFGCLRNAQVFAGVATSRQLNSTRYTAK